MLIDWFIFTVLFFNYMYGNIRNSCIIKGINNA